MTRPERRSWSMAVAMLMLLAAARGVFGQHCASCGEKVTGEFFWFNNPSFSEKQVVCSSCSKLDTLCATCRLPLKRASLKLDDGRLLCAAHAREAVLSQPDADAVFAETKREMIRLLRGCGSTPDRNITMQLVDAVQMGKFAAEVGTGEPHFTTVGLTRSRRNGTEFTHMVYLLSGQSRTRLMATGAHEYTHTWMKENVPPDRRLEPNAVEGFCELAACRLMADLGAEAEKSFILSNAYTRGQIETFVKAEDSHRFYRIVEWVKSGVEGQIEPANTASVLALRAPPAPSLDWPQAVPTKVPDTLRLKGISGQPGRWLALVNDRTLEAGETGNVRVGPAKVRVHCVTVTAQSVVVELADSGERQELFLRTQ
jgi:hypothetical protein